jgi:phytoene dehydrogenase-like protein
LICRNRSLRPVDLEQTYGLSGGHIHHGEQTIDQFFTFRPLIGWAQYRTPLKRLYLCGAGTHPGGGITGLPGANAAREIRARLQSGQM